MSHCPAAKRFMIAIPLGGVSGLLCIALAANHQPELASLTNPIFWTILTDRILLGMVVGLAGAYTVHPIFGFSYRPLLRGVCMGTIVSMPLATGAMSGPAPAQMSAWMIFTATLLAGGFYGALIDWLATRFGGEGQALLKS